jgi:hypothetical protein
MHMHVSSSSYGMHVSSSIQVTGLNTATNCVKLTPAQWGFCILVGSSSLLVNLLLSCLQVQPRTDKHLPRDGGGGRLGEGVGGGREMVDGVVVDVECSDNVPLLPLRVS